MQIKLFARPLQRGAWHCLSVALIGLLLGVVVSSCGVTVSDGTTSSTSSSSSSGNSGLVWDQGNWDAANWQ